MILLTEIVEILVVGVTGIVTRIGDGLQSLADYIYGK